MPRLPQVSGKDLCRALEKEGFVFVRQTGSHKIFQRRTEEGVITIPVPVHSGKPLKKGTRATSSRRRPFRETNWCFYSLS